MNKVIHFKSLKDSVIKEFMIGVVYIITFSLASVLYKYDIISDNTFGIFMIIFCIFLLFYVIFWTFYIGYKRDKGEIKFDDEVS